VWNPLCKPRLTPLIPMPDWVQPSLPNGDGEQQYGAEILVLSVCFAWCFWLTCKIFVPRSISWHRPQHHLQPHPTPLAPSTLKYTSLVRRYGDIEVRNLLQHRDLYIFLNSPE
jgi:hypothetical protein